MKIHTLILATAMVASGGITFAQDESMDAGSQALMDANQAMMDAMQGMQSSDDTDQDFANMMIAHHQGAIDMARVELEHGDDPQLREMAEKIIEAQEAEIAEFQEWLSTNAQ